MAEKSLTFNLFGHDVSASGAVKEFADKAHGHITGLIGDLAKLAVGFLGVQGIIEFGKHSVEAASTAEAANAKLDVALKNTHSSFKANSAAVDEQKSKLTDFGFTGAQTTDALAVLTTSLGSSTKALSLMQLTADLAKYKNIDLSSAALIVAKGFEGQIRPLKALGIDLPVVAGGAAKVEAAQKKLNDAQQAEQDLLAKYPNAASTASKHHAAYEAAVKKVSDAQDSLNSKSSTGQEIIDALTQKLSGQAEKSAETYAGKVAALNAKWDEFQVKVGTGVMPALSGLVDFLNKSAFPAVDKFFGALDKDHGNLFQALGAGSGSKSGGPLSGGAWSNGASQLTKMLSGGGYTPFAAQGPFDGTTWVNGWNQLMDKLSNGWSQLMGKLGNGWDQWRQKFANGLDQWGQKFSNGWSQITGAFANGWRQIEGGWSGVLGAFGNGWSQIQGAFSNGWSQIRGGWSATTGAFSNGWSQITGSFSNGWSQIQSGWSATTSAFGNGWNQIEGAFSHGWSQIQAAAGGVWAGIKSGWDGVVGAFQNGWDQIQAFITGHPVHGTIQWTNSVPGPPVPTGGGGGSYVLRPTASGGLFRAISGGHALQVAEAGTDEAVLPLNDRTFGALGGAIARAMGGGAGGGTTNITINEVHDTVGTANAVFRRLNARGAV